MARKVQATATTPTMTTTTPIDDGLRPVVPSEHKAPKPPGQDDVIAELLREMSAMRSEMADLRTAAEEKTAVKAAPAAAPNPADKPFIAATVKFKPGLPGMRDEAARLAYERLYDSRRRCVFLVMESTCGASVQIKDAESFPRFDMPCPCGRHDHWMIKYIAEDK